MMQDTLFRCLRCGHKWTGPYDRKVPIERACPECGSNSQRPLIEKKKKTDSTVNSKS